MNRAQIRCPSRPAVNGWARKKKKTTFASWHTLYRGAYATTATLPEGWSQTLPRALAVAGGFALTIGCWWLLLEDAQCKLNREAETCRREKDLRNERESIL